MVGLFTFSNLLAEFNRGEFQVPELMGMGLIPTAIALLLFGIGVKLQYSGKPKWIKWLSVVVLVVGAINGITPMQEFYGDPIYRQLYGGTWKSGLLHASGVMMPVAGLIVMGVWNYFLNRNKFEQL